MDIGAGLKGLIGLSCVFFSMDDWDENGKTVVRWSVPAEGMAKLKGREAGRVILISGV